MQTFLIGLIVITSTLYTLYKIGQYTARFLFKQLDPTFEDIFLCLAILIGLIATTTLLCMLIYLVGEAVIRMF